MAVDKNKRIKRRVRNAYIVSTVSIALVLFLLGAVGYLIMGALNATERLKENVTVYVMLRDDITAEQSAALKGRIEKHEGVREVKYTSKDEAAAEFQAYLGDDFVGFLQENPLPDMYEVKVASTSAEKEALSALERQLLSWEGVDEVVYQRSVIDQITSHQQVQPDSAAFRRDAARHFADSAQQYDSGDDLLEALYHPYDEAGRRHALVHHEAFSGDQRPAGTLCRADLLGDARGDDRGAQRGAARGELRGRACLYRGDLRRADGRRHSDLARFHELRRAQVPADEYE